jgi:hypothetical protein
MTLRTVLRLKVQRINQFCLFELTWGRGQQLSTTLPYPEALTVLYEKWRRVYRSYYEKALRGRVAEDGILTPTVDWHAKLVEAQSEMLFEFHRWLQRGELFEIRAEIARIAKGLAEQRHQDDGYHIDIFLTCNPIELERFPWETWEVGTEFAATGTIRMARTPINIRAEAASTSHRARQGRARILAILGDDTGLNFELDRQAVRSLSRVAEVKFVGWQHGQAVTELKTQICQAITDEQGWDVLFFAGHSNEKAITGGDMAIAPNITMSMNELAPQLTIAKARGLQFAIFNSCSGLSIATSLIDLGLSQVVVMREPIHNQVAQAFLMRFLQVLAEYQDVHNALLAACQYLKLEKNFTYPSAYLIPSLFCHPEAVLYRIEPFGLKQQLKQWRPTRRDAIALGAFGLLSLLPAVQGFLLEPRVLVQAVYRDITGQITPVALPPVLLVQIDEDSIRRAGISHPNPINRRYLARLIDQSALASKVVGIDYLLDRQQPGNDQMLAQTVRTAVDRRGTWFVFAADLQDAAAEMGVAAKTGIANPSWSLQGYINAWPQHVELPMQTDCYRSCPFAYLLAMAHGLNQQPLAPDLPQPQLRSQTDFRTQVFDYATQGDAKGDAITFLQQARLHPITRFSEKFGQFWLWPINDFSIPPDHIYERIPAWQLDNSSGTATSSREQQVVIVAPGGYAEAGVAKPGEDNFPVPLATGYWRNRLGTAANGQDGSTDNPQVFTGAEAHAYMIYHLLNQRLVVPIPDLWMIGLAVLLAKGTTLVLLKHPDQRRYWTIWLASAPAIYGLVGLQVYLSAGILLPWFLPSTAFWVYVLPVLRKQSYA